MITSKQVKDITENNDLNGFTVSIKGKLNRYIVATTHNEIFDTEVVADQANKNMYNFDNVTIGGWEDSETGKLYIDVGTSVSDLEYAINLAKYYNQIAIWDDVEKKEIRIK